MAKYKIIEGKGMNSKVEKTEFNTFFTMNEVKAHYDQIKKGIKELEAQKTYEEAKLKNIEENHKEVVDTIKALDEKQKVAIFMFIQSEAEVKNVEEKLAQFNAAMDEYNEELVVIKEQIGVDIFEEEEKEIPETPKAKEEVK